MRGQFNPRALPLSTRLSEKLAEVLVAAGELREELDAEDAGPVQYLVPEVDAIVEQTATALRPFAS